MQHAVRSRVPLLLLHLEGGRPEQRGADIEEGEEPSDDTTSGSKGSGRIEGEREDGDGEKGRSKEGDKPQVHVTGAWWNRAFGTLIADSGVEIRREIAGDGSTRVGVWTAGVRMGRYGPPL